MTTYRGALFSIDGNILRGPVREYSEDWPNLGKFVFDKLSKNSDFNGQFDIECGRWDSHKKIKERSIRTAVWMRNNGIKAGDVVSIYSASHVDVTTAAFATMFLGAIFQPLDRSMKEEELDEILRITKPKLVFASQAASLILLRVIEAAESEFNFKLLVYGNIPGLEDFYKKIELATEDDIEDFECEDIVGLDDVAFLVVKTSAFGETKIWELTHRSIFREINTSKVFELEGTKFVSFSQFYTIEAILYTFASLLFQKTKYLTPPFDHTAACRIIEKYKNDLWHLTSHACEAIIKYGVHRKSDIASVKRIVCGGGRTPIDFHRKITRAIPQVEVFYGFGINELAGTVTMPCINMRPGSSGRISENALLKVIDLETGEMLEKNQSGELYTKSPSVMKGFYNDPKATAESFDEEGWFRTGDIGFFDDNGEVFVVGRRDELISYQGTKIYPRAIEAFLMGQPGVADVAVVGVVHPTDGEQPIAFVVKMDDVEVTAQDLVEVTTLKLPEAKGLPGGVEFIKKIPRTPAEVIKRGELSALAKGIKEREFLDKTES